MITNGVGVVLRCFCVLALVLCAVWCVGMFRAVLVLVWLCCGCFGLNNYGNFLVFVVRHFLFPWLRCDFEFFFWGGVNSFDLRWIKLIRHTSTFTKFLKNQDFSLMIFGKHSHVCSPEFCFLRTCAMTRHRTHNCYKWKVFVLTFYVEKLNSKCERS